MPETIPQGFWSLDLDLKPEIYILINLPGDSDTTKHWRLLKQPAWSNGQLTLGLALRIPNAASRLSWASHSPPALHRLVSAMVCVSTQSGSENGEMALWEYNDYLNDYTLSKNVEYPL